MSAEKTTAIDIDARARLETDEETYVLTDETLRRLRQGTAVRREKTEDVDPSTVSAITEHKEWKNPLFGCGCLLVAVSVFNLFLGGLGGGFFHSALGSRASRYLGYLYFSDVDSLHLARQSGRIRSDSPTDVPRGRYRHLRHRT